MILEKVSFGYHKKTVVNPLSLTLKQGVLTAFIGANGVGKTSLLKGLAGVIKPLSGHILNDGGVAYLPQFAEINEDIKISLYDYVSFPFLISLKFWQKTSQEQTQKIDKILKQFKLYELREKPYASLSGGQQQRAQIARLLLEDAEILLLDEPFSALDSMTIETALMLLKQQAQKGKTVLCVLHDYELVRRYFQETLILGKDLIAFGETKAVLTPDNLHKAHHVKEGV